MFSIIKKSKFSTILFLIMAVSIIIGVLNYCWTVYNIKPPIKTFNTSVMLFMPNMNEQTTFILSNKPTKEWSTLSDIKNAPDNSNSTLTSIPDPKKTELFNIKYMPDPASFIVNYYNLFSSQFTIGSKLGLADPVTIEKPIYSARAIGNGYAIVDYSAANVEKANLFIEQVKVFQTQLISNYNSVHKENEQITGKTIIDQTIIENQTVPKVSNPITSFIAGFLVSFAVLLYLSIFIRNRA